MRVAILAGGVGTRLAEETEIRPKPMVEVGGRPLLWHIMKHYEFYGYRDFVIALGYKGDYIKRFFTEYSRMNSDMTIDLGSGEIRSYQNGGPKEDWVIELVETGRDTATGGRIKRLAPAIGDGTFMLTWGDGVSTVDLDELLKFHRSHGKLATVTAVRPPARFGKLDLDGNRVTRFSEKPQLEEGWINGAFFVLESKVFDYVAGDDIQWEREPLEGLAADGELMAYRHDGFWQCMDTLRDKKMLQAQWESGNPPWRIWDDE
jgi:glucose-1-phosphate cytidylyltransferase